MKKTRPGKLRRIWKFALRCFLFCVVISAIWLIVFFAVASRAQSDFRPINDPPLPAELTAFIDRTPDYRRPEDASYLSFPEWYLVFCPQEYAQSLTKDAPSHFAYFGAIGQLWRGYAEVHGLTHRHYPFNFGRHLTMVTITMSSTVEFGIKGCYEKTIGRFFEWLSGGANSTEDAFAARVAKEYGDFIPTQPWYDFPFGSKLGEMWSTTKIFGPHFLRKCERKAFLSAEYGIKAIYAGVIRLASHSVYGLADKEIYCSVNQVSEDALSDSRIRKVRQLEDGTLIITLPHYQGFTDTAPSLAKQGASFNEIAGTDEILLTFLAPSDWKYDLEAGHPLFTMTTLGGQARKRFAIQAPVKSLGQILRQIDARGLTLEHLFDY